MASSQLVRSGSDKPKRRSRSLRRSLDLKFGMKEPSANAAADLITLNRKVQVGRLPGHQAFRNKANMHNSVQICHPKVIN